MNDRVARVIPCLDVTEGRVVKGVNFVGLRDAGDPVELAQRYDAQGADELVFLDITASSDHRAPAHGAREENFQNNIPTYVSTFAVVGVNMPTKTFAVKQINGYRGP